MAKYVMSLLLLLLLHVSAPGVCVSVGGTALLASAAYLMLRNRQGPAAQLAALRTMGTSTVGLIGELGALSFRCQPYLAVQHVLRVICDSLPC
jgi:type IV secretory pathway TrbL component